MPVAAIDCGTNSLRLLIAERAGDGLRDIERRLELPRLGEGVDASGEFAPAALERVFEGLRGFVSALEAADCDRVRMVATSAARDARNREEFFAGVHDILGIEPEIIAGEEEARLSYRGARTGVPGATDPVLVTDVGGGSTEFVLGAGAQVVRATSLNVGSVRLRERFRIDSTPTPAQRAAAAGMIDDLLDGAGIEWARVRTWIGVAGTATTLAAFAQELPAYDRARVQGYVLDPARLDALTDELWALDADAITARYPWLARRRAEVIGGGALILSRAAQRMPGRALVVCESDLLDAIALELLDDSTR